MSHILDLLKCPTFNINIHLVNCRHITSTITSSPIIIIFSATTHMQQQSLTRSSSANMANTTRTRKKVAGPAASEKKGSATMPTKVSTTTKKNKTKKTSLLSIEPNELKERSRVTRSTAQPYHHDIHQKPAFPAAIAIATSGINDDDSSSSDDYVAKGNAFCHGVKSNIAPTKSNKIQTVLSSSSSYSFWQ